MLVENSGDFKTGKARDCGEKSSSYLRNMLSVVEEMIL